MTLSKQRTFAISLLFALGLTTSASFCLQGLAQGSITWMVDTGDDFTFAFKTYRNNGTLFEEGTYQIEVTGFNWDDSPGDLGMRYNITTTGTQNNYSYSGDTGLKHYLGGLDIRFIVSQEYLENDLNSTFKQTKIYWAADIMPDAYSDLLMNSTTDELLAYFESHYEITETVSAYIAEISFAGENEAGIYQEYLYKAEYTKNGILKAYHSKDASSSEWMIEFLENSISGFLWLPILFGPLVGITILSIKNRVKSKNHYLKKEKK